MQLSILMQNSFHTLDDISKSETTTLCSSGIPMGSRLMFRWRPFLSGNCVLILRDTQAVVGIFQVGFHFP